MKAKRPFNLSIRAQADDSYVISIRGIIGEYVDYERWTISDTEQDVLNELKQIPEGKQIHCFVNSRGGDVGLGCGIYNGLSTRKNDLTTYNCGYAMSAASIVMLAGSRRVSPTASIWMIHRASGGVDGTGDDMRSMADGMDVVDDMMAKIYAEVSGKKTAKEFRAMMDKTSWFDGEEAVALGLATESSALPEGYGDDDDDDDDAGAMTDEVKKLIAKFEKRIPKNLRARLIPAVRAQAAAIPAAANQPTKTVSMKLITAALVAAGFSVAIDAEENTVLPIINSIISQRAELKAANDKHETALKNRVTAKVDKAITDKLIKAERKDALIKAGLADESTLEFIDDLRAETATHRPRGVAPARREGEGENDTEANIIDLQGKITNAGTAEERGEFVAQSLKLRGLDQLFTKKTAVKAS